MSAITIELPEPLREEVARLAATDGISLDQFFALAARERIEARTAADTLEALAAQADDAAFDRVMAKVPPSEPKEDWDRLPAGWKG